jgi:hypothetical protein
MSICNRTAAGQPDVESLCPPLWAPFRPSDNDESKNPTSVGGSRWVSKREIRLGSCCKITLIALHMFLGMGLLGNN